MLQYVMKDYAHEAAMDLFIDLPNDKHTTSLAALNGVRAAFASETNENRTWNSALVRRLTGGDPITARFMRQDDFTFLPVCKLSVISNHQPNLSSVNDADRRRHNHVPFTFKPPTVDKSLWTTLEGEAAGILRWQINGCLKWQKNGLVRPDIVKRTTEAYLNDQDHFGKWVEDYLTLTRGGARGEPTWRLFASWKGRAERANIRPGRENEMVAKLVNRYGCVPDKHISVKGSRDSRGLTGVELKVAPEDEFMFEDRHF